MSYSKAQIIRMGQTGQLSNFQIQQTNTQVFHSEEVKQIRNRSSTQHQMMYASECKKQEKNYMEQLSNAKVKNWPNTLEAKRKLKDNLKFERFKQDEEQRRLQDEEEFQYQTKIKQQILDKANKQIYDQMDKVKAIKSKMLLSDNLQEREKQMAINDYKKEVERKIEENHYLRQQEQMKVFYLHQKLYDIKEEEKWKDFQQRKQQLNQFQSNQHQQMKDKYIKNIINDQIEGELIKTKAIQYNDQEQAKETQRKIDYRNLQKQIKEDNQYSTIKRSEEEAKQGKLDLIEEQFAKKKDLQNECSKIRTKQLFDKKCLMQQKNVEIQEEIFRKKRVGQENVLNKQAEEIEQKYQLQEKAKSDKIAQCKEEIKIDRQIKIEIKQIEKEKQLEEKKIYIKYQEEHENEMKIEQNNVDQQVKYVKHQVKDLNLDIIKNKQDARNQIFIKELEDTEKMKDWAFNEKKNFNSWAHACLNEWESNGKELKPIILKLSKLKEN